jgi:hypothetical protein
VSWFKLSVVACMPRSRKYRGGERVGGGLLGTYPGRDNFSTLSRQALYIRKIHEKEGKE